MTWKKEIRISEKAYDPGDYVYELALPEYTVSSKPDYKAVGAKLKTFSQCQFNSTKKLTMLHTSA